MHVGKYFLIFFLSVTFSSRPFKFLFLLFFSLPRKRCRNQWSCGPRYYAALRTFAIIVSKNLKCLENHSNNLLITTNTAYTLISNKKFKTLNNLRFTIVQLTCQCRYFWLDRVILKTGVTNYWYAATKLSLIVTGDTSIENKA